MEIEGHETPTHPPHAEHGHATHAHTPASPPAPKPTNRVAVALILIALIAVIGIIFIGKLGTGPGDTPVETAKVQIKLLVDDECEYCFQTNTILPKLEASGIKYDLQTIPISSDEGKALAQEFAIDYLPTALVNVKGLDQNSTIQRALQGQFINDPLKVVKGWVVVPEKFLDKDTHLISFLKTPEACTVPEGKIVIDAFLDFGDCQPCAEAYRALAQVQTDYNNVDVRYTPIVYNRTTVTALQRAITTNTGAVCVDQLGYLNDYVECNFFNVPFVGSADINYMRSCLADAGGSSAAVRNSFNACVNDVNGKAQDVLVGNTLTMHKWNPLKYTPSFVVDCKYSFVGQNLIVPYLCALHPELNGCPAILEALQDTNSTTTSTPPTDGNAAMDHAADTNVAA